MRTRNVTLERPLCPTSIIGVGHVCFDAVIRELVDGPQDAPIRTTIAGRSVAVLTTERMPRGTAGYFVRLPRTTEI